MHQILILCTDVFSILLSCKRKNFGGKTLPKHQQSYQKYDENFVWLHSREKPPWTDADTRCWTTTLAWKFLHRPVSTVWRNVQIAIPEVHISRNQQIYERHKKFGYNLRHQVHKNQPNVQWCHQEDKKRRSWIYKEFSCNWRWRYGKTGIVLQARLHPQPCQY